MKVDIFINGLIGLLAVTSAALLGVDFGQEFTKAMLVSPHAPLELVLTPDSKRKDVSGLAIKSWKGDIERVYGSGVASAQVRAPQGALMHVKPLLGKKSDDDTTFYHKSHPGTTFTQTNRDSVAFKCFDHDYPVEQVFAMNLDETIGRANAVLSEKNSFDSVDSVAVTVPEFFTQDQRLALHRAAELPRAVKAHLVNDGLSVAIDFALKQRDFPPGEKQYFIIYDMGSGSTRASLFSIEQPVNQSEALTIEFGGYGYDSTIGGSLFTHNVAELLKNKFLEHNPTVRTEKLDQNARSLVRLYQAAEKAKLILSANSDASVHVESLFDDIDFKTTITRQEFEDFSEDLTVRIVQPILDALKHQFLSDPVKLSQVSSLILTGGSTRTPMVQKSLAQHFGEALIAKNVNADESSVNGVTIRGIQLFKSFQTKALNIIDRSIHSYGIIVNNSGLAIDVFQQGSQYPNRTSILIPAQNDFGNMTIDLLESDELFKTHLVDTEPIQGRFDTKNCPHGVAYNATFALSQERLFDLETVEAVCLQTADSSLGLFKKLFSGNNPKEPEESLGNDNSTERLTNKTKKLKTYEEYAHVQPLSISEKLRIRQHMDELNERDGLRLKIQEQINNLENILYNTRSFLEEDAVLTNGPAQDVESLNTIVSETLEWLDYESDGASITDLIERIDRITSLRDKIELYLKSADQALDLDQFKELFNNGSQLLSRVEKNKEYELETLKALNESFTEMGLDVKKEHKKLKPPRHLALPNYKFKESVKAVEQALSNANKVLADQEIDSRPREELFELKLNLDSSFEELAKYLDLEDAIMRFKFSELASLYSRRLRVLKKREERRKAQESSASLNATSVTSTEQIESETTSTTLDSSNTEESTLEHDEL